MKSYLLGGIAAACIIILGAALPHDADAFTLPAGCENLSLAKYDTDGDGLDDRYESCVVFTNPNAADTDGDGIDDFTELVSGFSPRYGNGAKLIDVDSDGDYLNDDWELKLGTGLMTPDSDGDGYLDGTEVAAGYDPRDPSPSAKLKKLIEVHDKQLRLTYSMGGIVLGTLPVSTGKPATPTPHGDFTVLRKIDEKAYIGPGYDLPGVKYNLWFAGSGAGRYYIHSAYWHNSFGRWPVSGGCVNVRLDDMAHLYWWAQTGTEIVIS